MARLKAGLVLLTVLCLPAAGAGEAARVLMPVLERACGGSLQKCSDACERGDAEACYLVAVRLSLEPRTQMQQSFGHAKLRSQRACRFGNTGACRVQEILDKATDAKEAAGLYQKACDDGLAFACCTMGGLYLRGLYQFAGAVPWDATRAAQFYQRACDRGEASGCSALGALNSDGTKDVPKDAIRAVQLFQKACAGGEASGCSGLGRHHAEGAGVAEDPVLAAQFYRKACDGGEAYACIVLGAQYAAGHAVGKSGPVAAAFYHRAGKLLLGDGDSVMAAYCMKRIQDLTRKLRLVVPNATLLTDDLLQGIHASRAAETPRSPG